MVVLARAFYSPVVKENLHCAKFQSKVTGKLFSPLFMLLLQPTIANVDISF